MSNILHIIDAFWQNSTISKILPKTQLQQRFANGVFWTFVGSIVAQGSTLISTIPVARLLGINNYGKLGIIQSTLMTFIIFSGPSLGQTATKYIAELRNKESDRVGKIIGLTSIVGLVISTLLGIVLYKSASYLAIRILNTPLLSLSLQIAAITLFFNSINGTQLGILAGFEAFNSIAKINFIRGITALPTMVIGAYFGQLNGVIYSLATISFITVLITQIMINKITRKEGVTIQYRESFYEWKIIPIFYIPTVFSGLIVVPMTWVANAMLVNQLNGYREMGIFNAANQWRMAVQYIPSIVSQPILPILSNLYGNNALLDFRKLFKTNLILTFATSLIPSIFIALGAKWIMKAYGSEFSQGVIVLILLVLSALLSSLAGVIGTAISSIGKRWHATIINFLWAVTFLIATLLFIKLGATGLSLAYLISYSFHFINFTVYTLVIFRKILQKG